MNHHLDNLLEILRLLDSTDFDTLEKEVLQKTEELGDKKVAKDLLPMINRLSDLKQTAKRC